MVRNVGVDHHRKPHSGRIRSGTASFRHQPVRHGVEFEHAAASRRTRQCQLAATQTANSGGMRSVAAADLKRRTQTLPEQLTQRTVDTDGVVGWKAIVRPAPEKLLLVPVSDRVVCGGHNPHLSIRSTSGAAELTRLSHRFAAPVFIDPGQRPTEHCRIGSDAPKSLGNSSCRELNQLTFDELSVTGHVDRRETDIDVAWCIV